MFTPIPPELLEQWHPTKNNNLDPKTISRWKRVTVWWQCELGHEWQRSIESRNKKGGEFTPCPVCSGMRIHAGFNDLATVNPRVASEWHPTKNGDLKPSDVGMGDGRKVWWLGKCDHEWESSTGNRTNAKTGTNCPYCSGNKVLIGFNDLTVTHPELVTQWHPTKNKDLFPADFSKGSAKEIWWLGECTHEWKTGIYRRVSGRGCPYCSGNKVLVGFNDLKLFYPFLIPQWHPTKNGELNFEDLTWGSSRKVWWICEKDHEWEAGISDRVRGTGGSNCPYCANKKIIEGENDFASAHPILASEWHPTKNMELLPTQVSAGSNRKVWWVCENEHEWQTVIVTRVVRGDRCPYCFSRISKAEQEIFEALTNLKLKVEQSNSKVLKGKELDIYLPEKNIAIEFNGLYWHSEEAGKDKNYHYNKWLECKQQGIQLIQIWEDDWNKNKDIVLNGLKHKIGISEQKRIFARKTTVVELPLQKAQNFLNKNHIQGFASGSYYLGLVEQKDRENLVAVLVLKKESETSKKGMSIVRYATNANVVGGFTKLLKHAEKEYSPEFFATFSNNTVSDGGLYANSGFVVDKEIAPDYMYIVRGQRKHKFGYRLKRFKNDSELMWKEGLSESELAVLNGIPRIWDAGKTRWVKRV